MGAIYCARGCRHWGRYGAAGLLVHAENHVLLQLRGVGSHSHTWTVPGGGLDPGESPLDGAIREAHEEVWGLPVDLHIDPIPHVNDHSGWAYTTFLAEADEITRAGPRDYESIDIEWVRVSDVTNLRLHPEFRDTWPALRQMIRQPAKAA